MSEPTRRARAGGSARGQARLVDVARLAGVAPITVSRALRDPDKVAANTRARIEAAVQQANYVPDMVASSLASQRSGVVAVVVPTLANSIFSDTVQGLADCLREHSYQPIIGNSGYDTASEEDVVAALLGRRPDGLILTGTNHSARTHKLVAGADIPVVETWELSRQPLDSVVGFSNRAAGQAMTRALVEAGYQRIGFIGPGRHDSRTAHRRDGYGAALRAHGLGPPRTRTTTDAPTMRAGTDAFLGLLEEYPDTDAVFCSSDVLAAGALFECQRRGWPVPDRVAIAGFGDFDFAGELTPSLTTLRAPRYSIGVEAASLLLRRLDSQSPPGVRLDLGFEVVRRDTA